MLLQVIALVIASALVAFLLSKILGKDSRWFGGPLGLSLFSALSFGWVWFGDSPTLALIGVLMLPIAPIWGIRNRIAARALQKAVESR